MVCKVRARFQQKGTEEEEDTWLNDIGLRAQNVSSAQ